MSGTFNISLNSKGDTLKVGFGDPGTNQDIVRDVVQSINELKESWPNIGGPLLKINGPCSLPAAFAISHAVDHLYGVIAVWDPKLSKYVVSVSHDPERKIGDLID